ncbi:MAG: SPFH domain-containing protein [Anaerolineae bacterium]|nr:SPFH domain-containing protein [Anaerolineae bacterium]
MARIFDVIEAPDMGPKELVRRFPPQGAGDFRIGSQVIVRESQAAVFFRDGKALDTFGPGRHTITTANVPLLIGLIGKAFNNRSPFTAEVYFVNLREILDMRWGTAEPITVADARFGMARLRAFGRYSMQVTDPQMFVNTVVGQQGLYQTSQVEGFLRGIVLNRLTDLLGELQKPLLELPKYYEEISAGVRAKIADEFAKLGLTVKTFIVESISPTEEMAKAIEERIEVDVLGGVGDFEAIQRAKALREAAQASGEGGLAGMGVGLGAGMALGQTFGQQTTQRGGQAAPEEPPAAAAATCPECGQAVPAGAKFCPNCGAKQPEGHFCPECGKPVPAGAKFCPNCGAKQP